MSYSDNDSVIERFFVYALGIASVLLLVLAAYSGWKLWHDFNDPFLRHFILWFDWLMPVVSGIGSVITGALAWITRRESL